MRVLILNSLYPPAAIGGAEKSVSLLAEGLLERGDDVSVACLHRSTDPILELRNGVRVHRLPIDNLYWPFGETPSALHLRVRWQLKEMCNRTAAARIAEILDSEKPDVVHTNNLGGFSAAVWVEVKKRRIRLIHTIRDSYMMCSRSTMFRDGSSCKRRCPGCRLFTSYRKHVSGCVDALVSISHFLLDRHKSEGFFPGAPAEVIFNSAESSTDCRPPARTGEDALIFGYLGRIEPEKGIEVLLNATERLKNRNWRLLIAGSGVQSYVDRLKSKFGNSAIEWLGFTAASEFFPKIDVAVVPSVLNEGLSRVVIEAFAAGKSAICASSGGIPEVAAFGKKTRLYPPKDAATLAAIIDEALLDVSPWRDGGWRDVAAAELFSHSHVVGRYRALYSAQDLR